MYCLIAEQEVKEILQSLNINRYYIEIDMKGAASLVLSEEYSDRVEEIEDLLKAKDNKRTPTDIYKSGNLLYPLIDIVIEDEEEDCEVAEKLNRKEVIEAKYAQKLNTWSKSPTNKTENDGRRQNRAKRVAFYSYKGGVGRSTALAVVARLLATKGFKVAVLDLDLEAPGLNSLLLTTPKISPFGVIDYLYHAPWIREDIDKKRFLEQYVVRENVKRRNQEPGQVIVMSAGGTKVDTSKYKDKKDLDIFVNREEVEVTLEDSYLKKLRYIDFDLYIRQRKNIFESLLEDIEIYTDVDIILMDARTGFSDVSGGLLNQFSDYISLHIQDNKQNREGIKFICEHIDSEKLLNNVIWSYTKVPKSYSKKDSTLEEFIASCVKEKVEQKKEGMKLNYHYLSYQSDLEDINAVELKEYIEKDQIPLTYKELSESIISITGLDQNDPTYIPDDVREELVKDLYRLASEFNPPTYISQRFLNEDLKLFVGFPGSGKKTFKNYMLKKYCKDVDVISFEEYMEKNNSPYEVLTNTIFLDWNYEEATQAVVKWSLQSEVFYKWLLNNEMILEQVSEEELEAMKRDEEYELDFKVAEEILNFVFGMKDGALAKGWELIFIMVLYRQGFVLPKNIIVAIELYIEYYFNSKSVFLKKRTDALFNINDDIVLKVSEIWRDIGEERKKWLRSYDEQIYQLIKAYEIVDDVLLAGEDRILTDEVKSKLLKANLELREELFDKTFEKSIVLKIFMLLSDGKYNHWYLSPIYRLMDFSEEDVEKK